MLRSGGIGYELLKCDGHVEKPRMDGAFILENSDAIAAKRVRDRAKRLILVQ